MSRMRMNRKSSVGRRGEVLKESNVLHKGGRCL